MAEEATAQPVFAAVRHSISDRSVFKVFDDLASADDLDYSQPAAICAGNNAGEALGDGMTRVRNALTVKAAAALDLPGRYADGGGLYLDVRSAGSKSWIFVYRSPVHRSDRKGRLVGKTREMGLGPFGTTEADRVSLAAARGLAEEARRLLLAGMDPLDERNRKPPEPARVPTFGEMADQFVATMEHQWRNEKHRAQWRATLKEHAAALRDKPVDQIDVADVLAVLKPIWLKIPETAGRLRGRIERVLNAAKAQGFRTGENPAAWRGHLENLLPKRLQLSRGHHEALAWEAMPEFMTELRGRTGVAALALEFTIMTAARSGEVRAADWSEIDLAARLWTLPARRMKAGREHRVPLVGRAVEILETVARLHAAVGVPEAGLIFPGQRSGAPLSDMSLSAVLKRMNVDVTVHGFRSSFKDWASEATSYPNELSEAALAHLTGDKVERAYRRGDALERRRELMEAWARFLSDKGGRNVVPLVRAGFGGT